ncbi:MAG: hypothetical protein Kow002_18890 [Anaerolineales bacterium]
MSNHVPDDPGDRMDKIVSSGKDDDPYTRLPKAKSLQPTMQSPAAPRRPPSFASPPASAPEPEKKQNPFKDLKFGPAFWTVTGWISLIVNGILIGILILLMQYLGVLHFLPNDIASGLVGGLFTNFEKMDAATIETVIPVDAEIPLDITVPVQTTTEITLANEVVIPRAHVRITTPNINIDSDAEVTLPAGTPLTVNLNFTLPVQTSIPIHLEVPVKIPLNQTELHEPFVGLQEVIRPIYCLLEPNAMRIDGETPVCR